MGSSDSCVHLWWCFRHMFEWYLSFIDKNETSFIWFHMMERWEHWLEGKKKEELNTSKQHASLWGDWGIELMGHFCHYRHSVRRRVLENLVCVAGVCRTFVGTFLLLQTQHQKSSSSLPVTPACVWGSDEAPLPLCVTGQPLDGAPAVVHVLHCCFHSSSPGCLWSTTLPLSL